jgi:hypothetical protein
VRHSGKRRGRRAEHHGLQPHGDGRQRSLGGGDVQPADDCLDQLRGVGNAARERGRPEPHQRRLLRAGQRVHVHRPRRRRLRLLRQYTRKCLQLFHALQQLRRLHDAPRQRVDHVRRRVRSTRERQLEHCGLWRWPPRGLRVCQRHLAHLWRYGHDRHGRGDRLGGYSRRRRERHSREVVWHPRRDRRYHGRLFRDRRPHHGRGRDPGSRHGLGPGRRQG